MYAKFAASFATGQGTGPGAEFMILANPGLPLSPDALKDLHEVSEIVDQIPRPGRFYIRSGLRCSAIYERILTLAQTSRVQSMADRDKALDAWYQLYDKLRPGKTTTAYTAYIRYQAELAAAQDAQNIAAAEHQFSGKAVPPGLGLAVAEAQRRLETIGGKTRIETALAAIQKVYDANVGILFRNLRLQFANAQTRGSYADTWLPVEVNPPQGEWLTDKGWAPWRFQQAEPAPGPAGAPPLPSMQLDAELKRISISRPWLDRLMFQSHSWFLPEAAGFSLVSSGSLADKDPGVMPLLVTGLLLARKLALTATWAPAGAAGARIPANLGPFTLSGPAQSTPGGFTLRMEAPQIIGFFCQALPRSPTPDPKWFP